MVAGLKHVNTPGVSYAVEFAAALIIDTTIIQKLLFDIFDFFLVMVLLFPFPLTFTFIVLAILF